MLILRTDTSMVWTWMLSFFCVTRTSRSYIILASKQADDQFLCVCVGILLLGV
jgi:hypothetical protein